MGNISETESEIEERGETMEERKRRETLHCSLNELHLAAARLWFMIPRVHTCVAVYVPVCLCASLWRSSTQLCDCSEGSQSERSKEQTGGGSGGKQLGGRVAGFGDYEGSISAEYLIKFKPSDLSPPARL